MKSNSSLPGKQTLADTAAPQCKGSGIPFNMIPQDDLDWAADQKPSVFRLFADCWRSDPYGTRWMQLNTKLKKSAFSEAKKKLSDQGLFVFKPEPSIQDGRSTVCWMVKNLHGSRVKGFWEDYKATELESTITDSISPSPSTNTDLESTNTELKSANTELESTITDSISPQTQSQCGVQKRSESFQYLNSRSSSISPDGGSGEEEFETQEKREEATQDSAIRPEGTSKPETVVESEDTSKPKTAVEPEGICTPESQASLIDQPESIDKPKDLDRGECSAASRENENQSHSPEDAGMLKWLVEVKLPAMELNEAPRNPEAYAKAMIRRDGDALREEFEEVVRDRQFREECAAVTEKVQAKADEWRQAGIQLAVFFDFDGRPQVQLDGATIAAGEFLNMPIGIKQPVQPISAFINPDHAQNRKARQSRLKTASAIGECPGLEFLVECWGDVLLQPQIKQAIKKHSHWGVFVNDQNQLEQFGSVSPIHCLPQVDQPSDSEVDFPQPQEIQMSVELHSGDSEYHYLMQISQTENS